MYEKMLNKQEVPFHGGLNRLLRCQRNSVSGTEQLSYGRMEHTDSNPFFPMGTATDGASSTA